MKPVSGSIPGVGPALATALVASIADPRSFRSGRDFSAWVGLVPKQSSSGGKQKLGNISKQGDRYADSLVGKVVDITGRIREYKGRIEIILNDAAQIKVK